MLILRLSLIVLIDKSLLKCLVVIENVNNVYLMTSFSMSRSLLLQFSSRQFFGFTGATGYKGQWFYLGFWEATFSYTFGKIFY